MLTSLAIHSLALALLLTIPAEVLHRSERPKELDMVFYRPRPIEPPPIALPRGASEAGPKPGGPPPGPKPKPEPPKGPGKPELPEGPKEGVPVEETARQRVGRVGILAFKEKFASLSQDKIQPRLGADARYGAADNVGQPSSPSKLMTNTVGGSGGINLAGLNHSVGGGGGGSGSG